ncbi:MAG: cell division protein FtsZ, partial [Gammaproteobacteria bacterium]|nr:cell division protein FtsZ [Gammaproteobacteria bacterium]
SMAEYEVIGDIVRGIIDENSTVIIGTTIDDDIQDELRVTIVATGIDGLGTEKIEIPSELRQTTIANNVASAEPARVEPKKKHSGIDFEIPTFLRKKSD